MKKSTIIFLSVNVIGVIVYLVFVLGIRANIKMEQRDFADFGDILNFLMSAVPVALACFIYCIIFGVKSTYQRNRQDISAFVLIVITWVVLILTLRSLSF
jgi:hypothetical protein